MLHISLTWRGGGASDPLAPPPPPPPPLPPSIHPVTHQVYVRKIRDTTLMHLQTRDMSPFTPLIFSATGGMASGKKLFCVFYKCLAALLVQKWDNPFCQTVSWLRCRLMFSLLRSSISFIQGARSRVGHAIRHSPVPQKLNLLRSNSFELFELFIIVLHRLFTLVV